MKLYSISLLFFISISTFAQHSKISINSITNDIYSYSFNTAKKNIENIKFKNKISSKEYLLLKTNYYWWQYLSGNKKKEYLDFCLQKCLKFETNETHKNNEITYQKALINCYIIRIYITKKEYFKAISQLDKTMPYFKYAIEHENEHEGLMLISGLYNYFIDFGLSERPLFYPYLLFYPNGNKQHGLDLLQKSLKSENLIIETEAEYFLMKIFSETEKKYLKAKLYAEILTNKYPKNLVYRYEYYKILIALKQYDKAKQQEELILELSKQNNQLNKFQKLHFKAILQTINEL